MQKLNLWFKIGSVIKIILVGKLEDDINDQYNEKLLTHPNIT